MAIKRNIDEIAADLANGLSLDDLRRLQFRKPGDGIPKSEISDEVRQMEREYWNEVFRVDAKKTATVQPRILMSEMEYDEARRKFWAILQMRAAVIETIEERPFSWAFTDAEKEILQNLVRYFINDPASKYPIAKGLFVYGAPGTGKTEIMRALHRFAEQEDLQKKFAWTNLSETYTLAKTDKEFNPIIENVTMNRAFDEFGRYTGAVMRYGDSLDINEAIIEQRYDRWKRYGQFSFFIANVTPNYLQEVFSPMILDRLREMCASVLFPGKSKRK